MCNLCFFYCIFSWVKFLSRSNYSVKYKLYNSPDLGPRIAYMDPKGAGRGGAEDVLLQALAGWLNEMPSLITGEFICMCKILYSGYIIQKFSIGRQNNQSVDNKFIVRKTYRLEYFKTPPNLFNETQLENMSLF